MLGMADSHAMDMLRQGSAVWNHWRGTMRSAPVDLSNADLGGRNLNDYNLLRANLAGANLARAQLEYVHLKDANLTAAVLANANLEGANCRNAVFDGVRAADANFEVSTLRGAHFRDATLVRARLHRAYLREADLFRADLTDAWLRFARLDGASCQETNFTGADLRHAAMVGTDLRGATLTGVQVFGVSAWNIQTDEKTQQDLIVSAGKDGDAPLRAHDLQTAQLLALMLDGTGVRRLFDSVTSTLVLILGSFSPTEKPVLDALRLALNTRGYVAVTFDFERPLERDYMETITALSALCRFVVADFTNAKEVRAEVSQVHAQYRRVPIIPIAKVGTALPITMANVFSAEELAGLVRYADIGDLVSTLQTSVIEPAEARAATIAAAIAKAEAMLRGQ
jgi:uncharacterized protein YjbI with pentapeptide repeats